MIFCVLKKTQANFSCLRAGAPGYAVTSGLRPLCLLRAVLGYFNFALPFLSKRFSFNLRPFNLMGVFFSIKQEKLFDDSARISESAVDVMRSISERHNEIV